jgi:hypothetical protein
MSVGIEINYKGLVVDLGRLHDEQITLFLNQPLTDEVFYALLRERGRRDNLRLERVSTELKPEQDKALGAGVKSQYRA